MNVLQDAPIWIWLLGSERLSVAERRCLDRLAATGDAHCSAMSLWEAQRLHIKGRVSLDRPLAAWLRQAAKG